MDDRKLKILAAVVDEYVRTGEPVGSKAISKLDNINVSAATIRNDMAALEQLGYLEQPHTSAGRIPTFAGYRLYIDELMTLPSLSDEEKAVWTICSAIRILRRSCSCRTLRPLLQR